MCGICGKLNFDPEEPVGADLLRRMMGIMSHRGPDGEGEYREGPVGLGHRRLSIIDLSTGDQPMCNEEGTVWVVYNGEIYNFRELRRELVARGHRFKSATDTEVIVHLYEECGVTCVARLRGMFAFALWDEREQRLLLARDRVGVKPLYYANTGKSLVFASEMKSIMCDPSVGRGISSRAMDRLISYYYVPGTETLFEGICKLEPGHYLTARRGEIAVEQYWDLEFRDGPERMGFGEAVESLQGLLRRTVRDHMISDVPVGVLLSGGVDSTGILGYMAEETSGAVHSFTVGFAGESFADERTYARMAAERRGTIHREITVSAQEFCDWLPQYVWHMEEPICEPPAVALYYVSRVAREAGVKVLLSGEGGDEAFGGYQNYRNLVLLEGLKSSLGSSKPLLRWGLQTLGRLGSIRGGVYGSLVEPALPDYYLSRSATPETRFNRMKGELYTAEFADALSGVEAGEPTRRLFARVDGRPVLDRMLYVDTKTWLPDDLLVKADRMTMATSVELRVPLLDFQVLEFAASLPRSFKVRGWSTKRILKAALKHSVPGEILRRRKTGFPVPYARWLRTSLRDFVGDTLGNRRSGLAGYLRPEAVQGLVSGFIRDGLGAKEVFCLVLLELWYERFFGGGADFGAPV